MIPAPGFDCTIEFRRRGARGKDKEIHPVTAEGQFDVLLPADDFPSGEQVPIRIRIGEEKVFSGLMPAVSGVVVRIPEPVTVSGRVTTSWLGVPRNERLDDLTVGIGGWFGYVRRELDEEGCFEAVVRLRPGRSVMLEVLTADRPVFRSRWTEEALAKGVEIDLRLGLVELEFVDSNGDPVATPVDVKAGWSAETGAVTGFAPVQPLSDARRGTTCFLVATGTLAGTARADGFGFSSFALDVESSVTEVNRVQLQKSTAETLRVELRDELGRAAGGWVMVSATGRSEWPGAFIESGIASHPDYAVEFDLPSAGLVDVFCGGLVAESVGVEIRRWDPRQLLRVEVPTGVQLRMTPRFLPANPVVHGTHSRWIAVPRQGGLPKSGTALRPTEIIELGVGQYDLMVANVESGFAGMASITLVRSSKDLTVEVPMLPLRELNVRLVNSNLSGRVFVRLRGCPDHDFNRWFSTTVSANASTLLPVPEFEGLEVCIELSDGRVLTHALTEGHADVEFDASR